MVKELLLYFGLYSYTVEDLVNKLEENITNEVTMRVNSPGGDALAAWGLYAKIEEHGNVTLKYDGMGASAAANLVFYAKRVECLDVTMFMFHRAASYNEDDAEAKAFVQKVNASLKKKMEARVSSADFKKVTGHSIEDMFNMETRLNVWVSAKQMKELGLVQKIRTLKPAEQKAMTEAMASWSFDVQAENDPVPAPAPKPTPKPIKQDMTLEKLKAEFPAVYAAIIVEGEKAGMKKENDRIMAWMAFASVDPKKVIEGITKGEDVTQRTIAEFQAIAMSPDHLAKLKKDSVGDVKTDGTGAAAADLKTDAKEKEIMAFGAEVDKYLGIKPKAATAA